MWPHRDFWREPQFPLPFSRFLPYHGSGDVTLNAISWDYGSASSRDARSGKWDDVAAYVPKIDTIDHTVLGYTTTPTTHVFTHDDLQSPVTSGFMDWHSVVTNG